MWHEILNVLITVSSRGYSGLAGRVGTYSKIVYLSHDFDTHDPMEYPPSSIKKLFLVWLCGKGAYNIYDFQDLSQL